VALPTKSPSDSHLEAHPSLKVHKRSKLLLSLHLPASW
jgi:hypothetical protein